MFPVPPVIYRANYFLAPPADNRQAAGVSRLVFMGAGPAVNALGSHRHGLAYVMFVFHMARKL
ncbi:MAG: hypothetical protein U1B30_15945 [Pseudomonadota bacterium]|nr:hypothetical protein [Pseudomonadota bacterium]